ncbi:heterokaryon incompatibility protein-domain-containing protein [Microdochium bolleyi]|uniref:Heterokaryon incompatibility protein-domain-containing protein n=1 Tax=Microdochium bolleyi TaxID=196109 RepID=A0A136J437_9PEZI|nr:heterokaryon incompatibility protein-domain-containing protein [Microdochium bolleyi]
MRLLHTLTHRLEDKPPGSVRYAILSHTWRDRELLFADVAHADAAQGWKSEECARKVLQACALAKSEGYDFIWVDNCCIDKSSSAELSEAINSMYQWYGMASVCYAFLADAESSTDLQACRYFTRGWTLQEMIAPSQLKFYNREWRCLGSRGDMSQQLSEITQIPLELLVDRETHLQSRYSMHILQTTSVATRMSWASKRNTARPEDIAYCLMGIFGVNMPLLYGEGGQRAFRRLQQEIMKRCGDQSILIHESRSLLANSKAWHWQFSTAQTRREITLAGQD